MYTLRFPFSLKDGDCCQRLKSCTPEYIEGKMIQIIPENDGWYIILIKDLASIEEAQSWIPRLQNVFNSFLFKYDYPVEAHFELPQYNIFKEGPVIARTDYPSVYNSKMEFYGARGGKITSEEQISSEALIKIIKNKPDYVNLDNVKVKLALDIYKGHFYEASSNAMFFSLINVLEVLAPKTVKTQRVIEMMEKWEKEIQQELQRQDLNVEDRDSFEHIKRELSFRKQDSIRRSIGSLITSVLKKHADVQSLTSEILKLYDIRSSLTHTGFYKKDGKILYSALNEVENLKQIVKLLLSTILNNKD